jgi:hypothetical protein
VHCAALERMKDEQVERALKERWLGGFSYLDFL